MNPLLPGIPLFVGSFERQGDKLSITYGATAFDVSTTAPLEVLEALIQALDGTNPLTQIRSRFESDFGPSFDLILAEFQKHSLLDDTARPEFVTGLDVLYRIEDLTNELLYQTLYKNRFWQNIRSTDPKLPTNVLYGLAIENYHFLFRESYFDSAALCFQMNTAIRNAFNSFYVEELGHDELILKGLNAIGITREELMDTVPLPQTMALCNALAYWANFDPLFFFTTLGVLEGKDIKIDSFVRACEERGLDESFVAPIRTHSNINVEGQHGALTRELFENLPCMDRTTLARLERQTRLFVEVYDAFYSAVWDHYSVAPKLLRRLSQV